jgi:hypothetical protein
MAKSLKELIVEDVEKAVRESQSKTLSQDVEKTLKMRFKDLLKGEILERS